MIKSLKQKLFGRVGKNMPSREEIDGISSLHVNGFAFLHPHSQIEIREDHVRSLVLSAIFIIDVWELDKSAFDGFNETNDRWREAHPNPDDPTLQQALRNPPEFMTVEEKASYARQFLEAQLRADRLFSAFGPDEGYPPWLEKRARIAHFAGTAELSSTEFPFCWEKTREKREEQRVWAIQSVPEFASLDPAVVEDLSVEGRKRCSVNRRSDLPERFASFQHLESLDLSFHKFQRVPEVLAKLPALKHLNLSENHLESLEGVESISTLETLNVTGNRIEDFSPLRRLPALREVRLGKNLAEKLPAFHPNGALELLDARRNPVGAIPRGRAWRKSLRDLKAVNFERMKLRELPPWFKTLPHLQFLNLSHNLIGEDEGKPRADFRGWKSAEALNLAHNALSAFPLLPEKVQKVDLRCNFLDGESPPQQLNCVHWVGVAGNNTAVYEKNAVIYSTDAKIEREHLPREKPFPSFEAFWTRDPLFGSSSPSPLSYENVVKK